MNILITGGAGYIGSVVCAHLTAAKQNVVVYDNLSRGHRDAVPKDAELIIGDISDRKSLDQLFSSRPFDAVLHFAALIEAGESMRAPEAYFRVNSAATFTLLEAMLAAGIKKLVFSSTAALYGEPERVPISESDTLKPTNVYGESKLLVERVLEWFNRIHGLRYASLRYFNAAGATETQGERHNPESHLIPLILQAANGQRSSISIFGTNYPTPDGTCIRDYIHVLDLAQAHILALEALSTHAKLIYNLGNGKGFSVREVIDAAERVTNKKIPVIEEPQRSGDPAILIASSEKIRKELHWRPQHSDLDGIIASAWNYIQFRKG